MATSAGNIPISATFAAAQLEKDVLSALNRIQSKSNLSLNTRNFSQPLGKITGLANEFNKSLEASNARVVAFGASAGLIFAVQKSFSSLVNTTIEVEKSLTDINVVLNTSSKGIKQFGDQLFSVAKNTGSAFKDVASAATEFSRQGLGLEETLKRTRDALILTRLSGLDVVSSTEALTAAVNSFTKEALTTTDVVNKLAAVDAKFAVSSRDLSEAIQRVGSSASEAGVSFDELLGIVTSVQQTTARGGAVIGNALKTIFTRIERPQVISDLKDFGIAVTDISGNALPTIKVIENLAQSFQNLNPVIKSQVAELVGGVYQINILKAALADVSKQNSAFAEATRTSSKAADEAILKNKALNESLSALLNETTINFTKFATSIGEASVGPGIRKVLGYINSSLESYNEKDAEGVGEKIATGVLSGVTNFITGPGLGIGAFAIGKLLANFTKFAGDATKNLLGLNTLGRQQAVLQSEIGKILSDNPDLIKDIISGSRTRLQVEQQIKQTLIEQAALSEQIKNSSIDIGGRFLASGLRVSEKNTIVGRRSAEGYIPAKQQAAEMVGAMQGGYTPGRVVAAPKSIGGIMNTAETVKYIPGFAQPYILPPQGSRAAQDLASKSMAKNGINPYMATGFVPNFIPMPLENDAYGYGDDEWLRRASDRAVPLANIRLDPKYQAAFDPSRPKGERFYRKDGAPFTANDLNHFVRAGAKYGEIRAEMPASILMSDKRYGKRKPDGTIFGLDDIRATYAPGKKIEAEQKVKEGIKQVYDPYIPPASMLVFDAMQKSSERDVNEDDLEKTGEMSTKRKTSGRIFKIKSYALNASALNEEKTGLIQKTQDFSRKMTKDLANYIRPGEYSDTSVDNFFGAAGKNYNVLAGTIFEASTNLAANYTRDKANSGGDFDVRGGNIGNIRQLFPGFTDQYGDYKLKNNDEAIRSFIDKVTKQYGQQIGNHFKEQEIKAGSVTSGFKTSSFGFIPNFAPKPFNFRFSNLGEKTAQISPKLRDWLADKYFDPEMASTGTLERLASLNRDSGAFFSSLENPNAVAGIPVRGQQGFVSRQNRGARAGAFLNALRARLPDFIPGSLPNLASGFIPNFAYRINKPVYSKTSTRELTDPETGSYLRYYPGDFYNKETKSQERSLNVSYIRSKQTGQGQEMFDRFSKMARRQKLKGFSDLLVEQGDRVGKIIPKEKYGYLKEKLSADEIKNYSILEDTSFEDIVKMAYPQLAYRQRGLSKNTKLSLNYRDYAGFLKYEDLSGKDILSQVQNKLKDVYGNNKDTLIQEILHKNIGINDLQDTFSKGYVPNFSYAVSKPGFNRSASKRQIHDKKTGSYLEYTPGVVDSEKVLKFGFINSYEKGQGHEMFDRYGKIARRSGRRSYSSIILPQTNKIVPKEKYDLLNEYQKKNRHILEGLSLRDALKISYPQLMYRERGTSKESSLSFMKISTEKSPFEKETLTGKKIFSSVLDKLTGIYGSDVPEFVKDVEARKIYISELYDTFSKGHVPNFAYKLKKRKQYENDKKNNFRTLTDPETGSHLDYYPGNFVNPNTGSYEKGLKISYIESNQKGQGQEMFDRYSKTAKRLGVNSYSSVIVAQGDKLKRVIPQKQYALLRDKDKEKHYVLEETSIEDIVKIAYPQLSYRQKGLSKSTNLKFSNRNYVGRMEEEEIFGKNILSLVQGKIKDLYKNDKQSFIDAVIDGDLAIEALVDTFSKGHIPNFNAVQEAIGREMAAGYSSSQVKVGQSSKLKTSFNPMGLGVYNSTEGSLNGGIGLAEKAGIDPKTKGMSSKGHIPNFADFGGADAFILIAAFGTLSTALKEVSGNFQNLKTTSDNLKKSYESAAASFASEMGKAKQSLNRTLSSIESEVKSTFTNIDPKTLKQKGSSVAPLVMGPRVRDALGTYTSSPQAASSEQVARLEELRNQTVEARKQEAKRIREARAGLRQMQGQIAETETPFFSRGSFSSGGKADRYVRGMGTQIGLIGSVISNVAGQFISPENKTAKAAMAGVGEISSFAGLGAQFGVPGMVLGGIAGLGSALLKLKDAKAEEAIDKINKSLGETKEKSSEFSGAAQNYSTSLEGLQNALNDPKTKPEALLKFQNNLTEALNSIPEEFRSKVLAAGSDITKVSEAIGNINKEMANTQKNLERQLAITEFIEKQSSIFGRASLKPKDQEVFNRLFTSSIKSEELVKKFTGKNAKEDFGNFIDSLKSEAIYDKDIIGPYNSRLGTETLVNKESAENIKAQLRQKTIIPEEIINQLDKAFAELDGKALGSLLDSIKKAGISVFDFTEKTKILGEIAAENAKRIKENEESLKALNNQYNNINLQISNQIDIEKNRAQTIREINKIQAEGVVSIQRARVKGLLESATPFISESSKSDIQNQLDLNEITSRQNSKIQEASNKLLDSFSNTIIKKSEEARSKVVPAIEGAKSENAIQQERFVFQNQIQKLTPLITQSLKEITSGGNIGDIQANLIKSITGFSKFKPEERDVLIQSLEVSFAEFKNTLAEIKAQGDVDIQIQEAQREYQKQSLALNQRLSFAGGAQALSSTGKTGVSDLFDNISELVSELRQTNTIGNAAQKGSSAFKLLDVLTNQLQLNRNINAPNLPNNFIGPNISGEMFNKQVSSDLTPLAATAIAGRVQQIRDSLDLARKVTEIQIGKTAQGTALGTAFDQAKEGAVRTALDQIASQFKLENMGNYLDVLQQEARFLNQLTQDQNSILESTLPKSINDNFNTVITREVGTKLTTLTTSLQNVINKLATDTKRTNLLTERSNLLPVASVGTRKAIFDRIAQSQDLTDLPKGVKFIDDKERISSLKTEIKDLESYLESLKTVGQAQIQPITKELQRYQPQTDMDEILSGLQRYQTEEQAMQSTIQSAKISSEAEAKLTEAKSTLQKLSKYEGSDPKKLESLLESLKSELIRLNEPTKQDYLNTTYEGLAKQIFRDFNQQMSIEDIKSLKENARKERNLATEKPLMDVDAKVGTGSGQGSKTSTDGGVKRDIPSQLRLLRENSDRITSLLAFRLQNDKELIDLNEKVNALLKGDAVDTAKRAELIKLQTELRAKTLEQEGKVAEELYNLYYKESYGETFFKDERAAFANAKIENEARQGRVDIGAITEKNTTYNRADFARDTGQLIDTFQTDFKSGIASAFGEAIKGTKTLKDAFRDMFQGILNRMLDKSLEMGVDALFAFGKAATGRKDGGLIRGYNSGGMVVGGSGMKDDVPAMMSGGEYVIKKSSVKKYGSDYLRALNGGIVPKYATGGFSIGPLQNEFLYNDPDRPTSGEFAIDSRLSAAALTDENNPQNRLRQDRYEKLDQYLQDRSQYEKDKQQAIKNYKNQVNSTFYSGLTAAAVQLGAAGLTVGAANMRTNAATSAARGLEPGGNLTQAQLNAQYARNLRSNGGYIARFAGGGSTGKDNIPALLMGGEYVMNKKAVDMYGRDFMNQLNTGTLPKYASGGMVGTSYTAGQNVPESSVTELVAALNTLNENLSKGNDITQAESGKISAAGANQESGMSVVNNISINVAQSGEVTSEANATTQNGGSNTNKDQNSIQNNAKLAELLRSKVVEVLVEQKRPGGLLYASR